MLGLQNGEVKDHSITKSPEINTFRNCALLTVLFNHGQLGAVKHRHLLMTSFHPFILRTKFSWYLENPTEHATGGWMTPVPKQKRAELDVPPQSTFRRTMFPRITPLRRSPR
jgi:hypothetical protein